MIPIQLLCAAVYTGTYTNDKWDHAYETNSIGGLLGASLSSLGDFVIAPIFNRIPRFLHTVIGTVVYIPLAIVAAHKFNDSLTSIMGVSSYLFTILIVIELEDYLLFRCCSFKNYNFDILDSYKLLPISLAAILSEIVGIIGAALGMSQTWFNGPIAKVIARDTDAHGADVGFEVGLIFTTVTYPLLRLIELYFVER
ncbi:unnamed protein product [Rotaria sp. Silwood1]|nr:unnamed protein product [Rotaria sp. Silwood1]CAF1426977.1 unnamed protein product [Rotaria sp. Silwood1]CAF3570050.1 unnamed protein product [Rotaria sp. Silwood1]CAF3611179.1 unnamed protein product [Rotaria sp. Silwood1]CAF3617304.1 unnamed protein product [Rotaria sp. Silwood1]